MWRWRERGVFPRTAKYHYLSSSNVANTLKSPRLNRCGAALDADDDIALRLDAVADAVVADFDDDDDDDDDDAAINLPVLSNKSRLIAHCSVMLE